MGSFRARKKRVKYNWLFIIKDLNMMDDFEQYVEDCHLRAHLNHRRVVSKNRYARAFVHHIEKLMRWHLDRPNYVVGQEESTEVYLNRVLGR